MYPNRVRRRQPTRSSSSRTVEFYYGSFRAVKDISISVPPQRITALIGPSGCGKSTLLRTINRMNDLIPGTRLEGQMLYHGENLYAKDVDPVEVRRRIGMVFQKPNPFPKSIYDNVAFGPRINGIKGDMDELVESSPAPCGALGRGQGQAQAVRAWRCRAGSSSACASPGPSPRHPDVILMDEPCSALDPRSTLQIEELMAELKSSTRSSSSRTTCSRRRARRTPRCS